MRDLGDYLDSILNNSVIRRMQSRDLSQYYSRRTNAIHTIALMDILQDMSKNPHLAQSFSGNYTPDLIEPLAEAFETISVRTQNQLVLRYPSKVILASYDLKMLGRMVWSS